MEFRPRDYSAEEKSHALPRTRAGNHPLSAPSSPSQLQIVAVDNGNNDFFDPLRALDDNGAVSVDVLQEPETSSTAVFPSEASTQSQEKDWSSFKRFLMQRFPVSKMVSVSSMSDVIIKGGGTTHEKSSTSKHLEELEDPQKFMEEGARIITRQEYVSHLHELKDEMVRAWHAGDRVTSLKLSIKVARLLSDTSVLHFYGTVFVLATEIMDMLGDLVWERIKQKAEFSEDGTKVYSLPENFEASGICDDAKETCYNWFCKIGAIRELLPRIYLELAILPCRRFQHDRPEDFLQRLVMMTRGLADPLASSYCRLYMAHCLQKLPSYDIVFLVRCVNDIKTLCSRMLEAKGGAEGNINDNKRLLFSLMEPTIEFIMQCIFKDASERQVRNVLVELELGRNEEELFGTFPCVSVVLHHLLKELPSELVSLSAVKILYLIECNNDSSFNQCLNYRLLGFRLCENKSQTEEANALVDKIIQVVTQYDSFDEYLKVVDAFMDIILQNQMDYHLNIILEGISKRACSKGTAEDEQSSLQSILVKLLSHHNRIEDMFALNHFLEILDVMYGSSRTIVNMHILNMATKNGYICDPTTIQLLFEISQALYDGIDFLNVKDAGNQPARLISRFVNMVDYGLEMERHLTFLVECRGAFGGINGLKEIIIHSSNCLAVKALKYGNKHLSFIKSCIAFCEVTLPSISSQIRQLNLYLETAEVALLAGLVSHSDGLLNSAISSLQILDSMDGSKMPKDVDGILSSIRKLCSLLVMVPGNPELGSTYSLKTILSLVKSQSWVKPRMRAKVFCSLVSLSATLSQKKLPYRADHGKVLGNDYLFYGDSSYLHELASMSKLVLQELVDLIQQEPSSAARGNLALEACNCIASSFNPSPEITVICSKLMETAKSCLSTRDKYLLSTAKFLDKQIPPPFEVGQPQIAASSEKSSHGCTKILTLNQNLSWKFAKSGFIFNLNLAFLHTIPQNQTVEKSMDLEVVGRHALLFDDDANAAFVNSRDALVEWNSLFIDRYDVRHLLSGPPPPRNRRLHHLGSSSSPSDLPDASLEPDLDHERYLDLPPPSDEQEQDAGKDAEPMVDGGYRAVAFSYGNLDEASEQKNSDAESVFRPPFPVPESLLQNLPPTEKIHQIIARTATFVSKHGGQSEIVLRVKQGDNPTFGFLMPDHHLHAYFRFLVDHQSLLKSDVDGKPLEEKKCDNNEPDQTGGALSLLGSVYGFGEDEDGATEDPREANTNKSQEIVDAISATGSHGSEQVESSRNTTVKNEVASDNTCPLKEKVHVIKRNRSINIVKSGTTSGIKRDGDALGSFGTATNKSEASAVPSMSKVEVPILEPPSDLKRVVDKIVEFILRNGKEFEAVLAEQDRKFGRFPFLLSSNQYHPYYLKVLQKTQQSKLAGKSCISEKHESMGRGMDKKTALCREGDTHSPGSTDNDIPYDYEKKEKFRMILGRSKKDVQDPPPKVNQPQTEVTLDADAVAAILKAATRGIKNPNLSWGGIGQGPSDKVGQSSSVGSLHSSQPQSLVQKRDQVGQPSVSVPVAKAIAETAALAAASEADSSEASLTKEQKLKAERLKRAKMFAAMIKSGTAPLKSEPLRSLSVEPPGSGVSSSGNEVVNPADKEREGSSVPVDVYLDASDKTEKSQKKTLVDECNERRSKRSYRSRSKRDEDDEENEEEEEEEEGKRDHKHSRKKHRSHGSSRLNEDKHKHRKRHSSSKDVDSRHSRKRDNDKYSDDEDRHSRHRHKHGSSSDDDEHRSSRRRRRHHSSSDDTRHRHRRGGSSEDEYEQIRHRHKRGGSHDDEGRDRRRSVKRRKDRSERESELEEGEICAKSDQSKANESDRASRETSIDLLNSYQQGGAPSQPSESTDVSDDLRAKIRAMLMATL
ncbi:Suppressor of white apricot protein [Trema orientale]|uniref:Suppressor of white apricot protein n=1 Tax=Trema orientale TaxID=63057 RepID=A0A2P5F2B9_TREOI|nr:Suppressor of white apricot protein [Trema orientale]